MILSPEDREKRLRAQEKFILDMQHEFILATQIFVEGENILLKLEADLRDKRKTWGESKNHALAKQQSFEEKLEKVKGLPLEDWENYRGGVESILREFIEALRRGIAHLRP